MTRIASLINSCSAAAENESVCVCVNASQSQSIDFVRSQCITMKCDGRVNQLSLNPFSLVYPNSLPVFYFKTKYKKRQRNWRANLCERTLSSRRKETDRFDD
jgi:hypothetical protein